MSEKSFLGHHEHQAAQPPAVPHAIPALARDQLIESGNSEYVATVGARPGLLRDDGSPSQSGDVLSVQPDGTMQTRPAGTAGPFERCVIASSFAVYRPKGYEGDSFLVPLVNDWPNK